MRLKLFYIVELNIENVELRYHSLGSKGPAVYCKPVRFLQSDCCCNNYFACTATMTPIIHTHLSIMRRMELLGLNYINEKLKNITSFTLQCNFYITNITRSSLSYSFNKFMTFKNNIIHMALTAHCSVKVYCIL